MKSSIKPILIAILLVSLTTLTGCHTVQGVGQDIESVGSI